jgi:hypothetical protein
MIKALLLIFEPIATWDRIVRDQRGIAFIALVYLVPLLAFTSAAEAYRLIHWVRPGEIADLKPFSPGEAILFEGGQFLLSLAVVCIGAKLIKAIGETFHGRHTFSQTFATAAYGLGPLFLLRFLDSIAGVPPWVSWAVGILLTIGVLYQGLPRMLQPDPPHAFGLFLVSSLLLVFVSGLARFLTMEYLEGKFTKVESIVSHLAARAPFLK